MASMMQAPRNRTPLNVDNPWDGDGFYDYLVPRMRRRAIRRKEKQRWQKEIREQA